MGEHALARVLVVAGHDPSYSGPGGGAGVDADRESIERLDASAACVVTAWTQQDVAGVRTVRARPAAEWLAEARAAASQPVRALKSGLLADAEAVRALATLVDELRRTAPVLPVVVDPVLAPTSGAPFLDDAGIAALSAELLPRAVVLTPNLPEAARLTGIALAELQTDLDARLAAARVLVARGARAVVLKGGHAADDPVVDLCLERDAPPVWTAHARTPAARLHGSGCRFASTLAAALALGRPLPEATRTASATLGTLLRRTVPRSPR